MPQLEIHHADGNVTYAELSEERPVMVGSGGNCDVVLSDPSVKKVHCRIVWRADRGEWRVEVAADAGGVQIGGRMVKAGTIKSGDVVGIGASRIYMDDAARPAAAEPSDVSTQLYGESDADDADARVLNRGSIRKTSNLKQSRNAWQKLWDRFRSKAKEQLQGEVDRPPGEERIFGSPLVRWLIFGFVSVLALAWYFWTDFRNKTIEDHFDKAQKSMAEENWEGAIHLFQTFEELYPGHSLASNARVQRALCEVQSAGSPLAAMEGVRKIIREQSDEKAFQEIVPKIGEVVTLLAQRLAESARDRADAKALERSNEAVDIIRKDLPGATISADQQAKLDATMEQARLSIKRFDDFVATRDAMDIALAAGNTGDAYTRREWLVQLYQQYAEHPEIVERLNKAIELDREAIKWEPLGKAADTQPRAGTIAASTMLMDRTASADLTPAGDGNVQFVLAGGGLSAHDRISGHMLWSMVVGRDTNLLPLTISPAGAPDPIVLVTDTRHDELSAVQAKTGRIVWRQLLGEPIEAGALLHRGKLYQTTGAGSLYVIDPASGRIDGRLKFAAQRFATSPVADLGGTHLYLVGDQFLVYTITLGGVPKCEQVTYTAHRPDSIIASPLRMHRYLVLFENNTASTVSIRVFLLTTSGMVEYELQNLPKKGDPPINGWVHHPPAVFGNLMFVATDLETVHVYSGGAPEKTDGFSPVPVNTAGGGTTPAGTRPQAYSMYYTEKDLLVAGSMVRHYLYTAEQQTLAPTSEKLPGAASQPIQRYPASGGRADTLFVARRFPGTSATALTALDATNLDTRWEVQLGVGVLTLQPTDNSKSNWLALTRNGQMFTIPAAAFAAGSVIDRPTGRIQLEGELSDKADPLVLPDGSMIFTPAGTPNRLLVRGNSADAPGRSLDLLAPLQAPIALFDNGILAPASDGRIYWLSPSTGKPMAEPFQPSITLEQPAQWRGVAVTAKNSIVAVDSQGNIYQIELRKGDTPHLVERGGTKLPKAVRSGIAVSGHILACVDEANVLHVWDADAVSPINEIKLSSPASVGPIAAAGHLFVAAGDEELVCVNPQGQEIWRHPLKGQSIVGRPLVKGDTVHLVYSSGLIQALRLADGSEAWLVDSEKPLAGGPVDVGDKLVVIGDDGSLNTLAPQTASN